MAMRKLFVLCLLAWSCALLAQGYSVQYFDEADGLSHGHVSEILQDTTGMIWIATWNGLNRFDGKHFVSFKVSTDDDMPVPNDIIRRLYLRPDNNLLCRIENRVLLFDTKQCCFDTLPPVEEQIAYEWLHKKIAPEQQRPKGKTLQYGNTTLPNILNEFTDRQGNIWSVSSIRGFYRSTPLPSHGKYLNHEEVRSTCRMRNGDVLAASRYSEQVMVFDSTLTLLGYMDGNGVIRPQPVAFGSLAYCMYDAGDGYLLVGRKPGGMIELRNGRKRVYNELSNVYDIQQDAEGVFWMATFGYGLWRGVRAETGELRCEQIRGTEHISIRRLYLHADGTLLAATTSGMLVIDDRGASAPVMRFHQRIPGNTHSLNSNAAMCVSVVDSIVYVGTVGGGVNYCHWNEIHNASPRFGHITSKEGLHNDIVYEIVPWAEDELLIQGNTAINIFQPSTGQVTVYGKSFFGEPASCKYGEVPPIVIDSNRLLLATAAGLYLFDKQDIQPTKDTIRIALNSIYRKGGIQESNVDHLSSITLAPFERTIVLSFAALDYRNNGEIEYSTRLYKAGEIGEWGPLTATSDVIMQDMQPGDYVFEIRSTDALGHLQNNIRTITIHVTPTFLESTMGHVLLIGLLLCVAVAITVLALQLRASRKKRAETLEAYLELQERLSIIEKQRIENPQLPMPEILSTGYMSHNEQFINDLHRFMENNIDSSEIVIDDMAASLNMSRASFNRKMKELFNLTPKDFIQTARIKHACSLLEATDMSAKEIAYACGFSDQRYFSKCFKTATGKTPTEWRTAVQSQ